MSIQKITVYSKRHLEEGFFVFLFFLGVGRGFRSVSNDLHFSRGLKRIFLLKIHMCNI